MSSSQRFESDERAAFQEEFLRLLLPLRDRLAHYARAVSKSREEADDLVSDAILAALEGFAKLRDRGAFASYLFRIASRLHKRRRWRAKLFGAYDEAKAHAIGSSSPSPETAAEVVLLHRALDRLPPAQREAVVLFEISGLSHEEICAIQGASLPAVKSRISRGRQELARILGARDAATATATGRQSSGNTASMNTASMSTASASAARSREAQLIYTGPQING